MQLRIEAWILLFGILAELFTIFPLLGYIQAWQKGKIIFLCRIIFVFGLLCFLAYALMLRHAVLFAAQVFLAIIVLYLNNRVRS